MIRAAIKTIAKNALGVQDDLAALRAENERLKKELAFETQRSAEYFHLIERIELQRNERWEMFLVQASEHANAQAMLEDNLMMTRELLRNAATQLNDLRTKAGLEPVKKPLDFADPPIGTASEYRERMKKLRESADALIDGKKERAEIEKKFDSSKNG